VVGCYKQLDGQQITGVWRLIE